MNRVIFQCEDSMEGILTGVYDNFYYRRTDFLRE